MDSRSPASEAPNADLADRAWHDHLRHLLDVGLRMLGNPSEAEDVVQEAVACLVWADLDSIEVPKGWLVVVVSHLCLVAAACVRQPSFTIVGLLQR